MKQHDRARFDIADNSIRHFRWITPDCVESTHGPPDQLQPALIQFRMNKNVFQTRGRPKKNRRTFRRAPEQLRAATNFRCDSARPGDPERTAGMRIGVVRDRVSARQDLRDEVRILFGVFADHKKRRPRLEAIE